MTDYAWCCKGEEGGLIRMTQALEITQASGPGGQICAPVIQPCACFSSATSYSTSSPLLELLLVPREASEPTIASVLAGNSCHLGLFFAWCEWTRTWQCLCHHVYDQMTCEQVVPRVLRSSLEEEVERVNGLCKQKSGQRMKIKAMNGRAVHPS